MNGFWTAFSLAIFVLRSSALAVEGSRVEFEGKRFTVFRVDVAKDHLELFRRDETGQPFKRFDRLAAWLESRQRKLVFAMNAGMLLGGVSPTLGLVTIGVRKPRAALADSLSLG